jgi:hypothetical protein
MASELFIKAATVIWQKCWSNIGAVYSYVTAIMSVWTWCFRSFHVKRLIFVYKTRVQKTVQI